MFKLSGAKRDMLLVGVFISLTLVLYFLPTGYEERVDKNAVRARGLILETDDSGISQFGIVKKGEQTVTLEILNGRFEGEVFEAMNPLMGMMDRDKVFQPGDVALVVISYNQKGEVTYVNPQSHYRIGLELWLLGLFAVLLVAFGGWTGLKALLSFVFAGLMIWKLLVPLFLEGYDPILVSLATVGAMTAAVIFLVAGPTKKGVVAFLGAFLGILTSCLLAIYFTNQFKVHGAVMPFAETLLYAGYAHLNLVKIYVAAVFLAASGAVMDLAMDVAASMHEVHQKYPDLTYRESVGSGFAVGRAVVGTMTTTLLLAYSGGYVTLLMAFMAQGVPLMNLFNIIYVAAEVLKTLVGSFGLVTVAPFTALIGGFFFSKRK